MAITMEHAIKHAISAALEKMEAYRGVKDYATCGQLADDLFEILFPGHVRTTPSADVVHQSVAEVTIPTAPVEAETKEIAIPEVKPKPKRKAPEKKPVEADPVEDLTNKMEDVALDSDGAESESKKPRKARAPQTDEQKAAAKAKRDAKKEPVSPPPDTTHAPAPAAADAAQPVVAAAAKVTKAKKASDVNLAKMNATQKKHLKKVATELKIELTDEKEAGFLVFINALSKEEFDAKKIDVHMNAYLAPVVAAPPAPAVAEDAQEEVDNVEFQGTTYVVATGSGRVYIDETSETGVVTTKHIGMCGMGKFKDLAIPTE